MGFGGYPSLPVMTAAWLGGYATAIHEQNAVLGRVNRRLAGHRERCRRHPCRCRAFCRRTCRSVVYTGNPVRPEAAKLGSVGYEAPNAGGTIRLLVFGGSQGARALSELVPAAIARLPQALRARLEITQQCRTEDIERVRAAYAEIGVRPS